MLRIVPFLMLIWAACGLRAHAEQSGNTGGVRKPGKYEGKIRAEVVLDEETGRLTYLLRCTADDPVRIHLRSLDGIEVEFSIAPDIDLKKVAVDSADCVEPSLNATLPYGIKQTLVSASDAGERLKEKAENEKDRLVKLNKDEAVSRSFYIYDTPWFDDLVKKLEAKKFKAYRLDPSPSIYTTDAEGKPVIDHQIEIWNYENAHLKKFNVVYSGGGLILDLAKVKKMQALKAKAPPPPLPEIAKRISMKPTAQPTARKSDSWEGERERGKAYRVVMEVLTEGSQFVPGTAKVVGKKPGGSEVLEDEGKNWKIEESSESRTLFVRIMPAEEKPGKRVFTFSGQFQQKEEGTASSAWEITSTLLAEGREEAEEKN